MDHLAKTPNEACDPTKTEEVLVQKLYEPDTGYRERYSLTEHISCEEYYV